MNVRIFYVYPQTVEIINELNLMRIVDKKLKNQ